MKRLFPFVLLLVAVSVWWNQRPSGPRSRLTYSGVVEATTIDCAFEAPGTVAEVLVAEGAEVQAGQPLARLDRRQLTAQLEQMEARVGAARARHEQLKRGFRPAEIAQAEARVRAAAAELEQLRNGPTVPELESLEAQMSASQQRAQMMSEGSRQEDVEAARSLLAGARTQLDTSRRDYERFTRLHREGAVSDQQLESRRNQWAQAEAQFRNAQQSLLRLQRGPRVQEVRGAWEDYRGARSRYQDRAQGTRPELVARAEAQWDERRRALDLMREGPRREEIEAAAQQLQEARAAVRAIRVQWEKAELKAPLAGRITVRNLEPGEAVVAGQAVLTLSDLRRAWVNLYIPEEELSRVHLGQAGSLTADGLQGSLAGKLVRIYEKAEFTPKFIQTPRERINLVFRAKLALDNPDMKVHPGQPVDVELKP